MIPLCGRKERKLWPTWPLAPYKSILLVSIIGIGSNLFSEASTKLDELHISVVLYQLGFISYDWPKKKYIIYLKPLAQTNHFLLIDSLYLYITAAVSVYKLVLMYTVIRVVSVIESRNILRVVLIVIFHKVSWYTQE